MSSRRRMEPPTGRFASRYLKKTCLGCEKDFWVLQGEDRYRPAKFCSRECWRLDFEAEPAPLPVNPVPVYMLCEGVGFTSLPRDGTLLPASNGKSRVLYYSHYLMPEQIL